MISIFYRFVVGFLLISTLGACASDVENSEQLEEQQPTRQKLDEATPDTFTEGSFTGLSEPRVGDLRLPSLVGVEGKLLFSLGQTLYLGQFNNEMPTVIDETVNMENIYVSPNGQSIIFMTMVDGVKTLRLTNLTSLKNVDLLTPDEGHLISLSWSPDSEWIAIVYLDTQLSPEEEELLNQGEMVSRAATNRLTVLNLNNLSSQTITESAESVAWLVDNSLLVVTGSNQNLIRLDPVTGGSQKLDISGEVWQVAQGISDPAHWQSVQSRLDQVNFRLAPYDVNLLPDDMALSSDQDKMVTVLREENALSTFCSKFRIVIQPVSAAFVPDTLFQTEENNVVEIRALTWSQEERVYFVLHHSDSCNSDDIRGSLMRLNLDDKHLTTITDQLETAVNNHYAFSPDGRYVAWSGADISSSISFIGITDLQTRTNGRLLAVTSQQLEESNNGRFQVIHWISD